MDLNQNLIFLVKIKNEIFQLLEEKEFLKDLEQTCDIFKQKHEGLSNKLDALLPLSFKITINFEEICNNSVLRNLITKETKSFLRITEDLVKQLANKLFLKDTDIFISRNEQVYFCLRITDLPLLDYKFSLRDTHIKRTLSSFRCIIFRTSPAAQYIRQSVWKCDICFNSPLLIQRGQEASHKAQRCFTCTTNCFELLESRVSSDYCTARVYEAEQIKDRKKFQVAKSFEIRLFDDLCQELKIGQEYIVIGIFESQRKFYHVFNISPA